MPAGSANAANTEEMKGGSAQTDRLRLEALKPFKERLVEFVGSGKWMHEMAEKMKELGMTGLMTIGNQVWDVSSLMNDTLNSLISKFGAV